MVDWRWSVVCSSFGCGGGGVFCASHYLGHGYNRPFCFNYSGSDEILFHRAENPFCDAAVKSHRFFLSLTLVLNFFSAVWRTEI